MKPSFYQTLSAVKKSEQYGKLSGLSKSYINEYLKNNKPKYKVAEVNYDEAFGRLENSGFYKKNMKQTERDLLKYPSTKPAVKKKLEELETDAEEYSNNPADLAPVPEDIKPNPIKIEDIDKPFDYENPEPEIPIAFDPPNEQPNPRGQPTLDTLPELKIDDIPIPKDFEKTFLRVAPSSTLASFNTVYGSEYAKLKYMKKNFGEQAKGGNLRGIQ